jgi:hypothetical protein
VLSGAHPEWKNWRTEGVVAVFVVIESTMRARKLLCLRDAGKREREKLISRFACTIFQPMYYVRSKGSREHTGDADDKDAPVTKVSSQLR